MDVALTTFASTRGGGDGSNASSEPFASFGSERTLAADGSKGTENCHRRRHVDSAQQMLRTIDVIHLWLAALRYLGLAQLGVGALLCTSALIKQQRHATTSRRYWTTAVCSCWEAKKSAVHPSALVALILAFFSIYDTAMPSPRQCCLLPRVDTAQGDLGTRHSAAVHSCPMVQTCGEYRHRRGGRTPNSVASRSLATSCSKSLSTTATSPFQHAVWMSTWYRCCPSSLSRLNAFSSSPVAPSPSRSSPARCHHAANSSYTKT